MSAKVVSYVFEHSQTTGSARVLMLALADMANNDGECWPGRANLARRVNVSVRQISRLIQECELLGELKVVSERKASNEFENNRYLITGIVPDQRLSKARKPRPKVVRRDTRVPSDTGVPTGRDTGVPETKSTQPSTLTEGAAAPPAPKRPSKRTPPAPREPRKTYGETSGMTEAELDAQADALRKVDPARNSRTKEAIKRALIAAFGFDPDRIPKPLDAELTTATKALWDAKFTGDDIPHIYRYCVAQGWNGFGPMAIAKHAAAWLAAQSAPASNGSTFGAPNWQTDYWDCFTGPAPTPAKEGAA